MLRFIRRKLKENRGAAMVEYGLLVAGVTLVAAAGLSIFGHKTSDLISATAAIMPGAHDEDNAPIVSGRIIETTEAGDGPITLDTDTIVDNTGTERLGNNLFGAGNELEDLVVDPPAA